jgi:hypothetical protein
MEGAETLEAGGLRKGENTALDPFGRFRDEMRDLMKRWNERLTVGEFSLADKYIEGRLYLTFELRAGGKLFRAHFGRVGEVSRVFPLADHVPHVERDPSHGIHRKKHPVLIDNIEFVKNAQGRIPSVAWIYEIDENLAQPLSIGSSDSCGVLQFSIINSVYEVLPIPTDREVEFFDERVRIEGKNGADPSMIEGASQIMDGIAEQQINACRDLLAHLTLDLDHSDAGILLGADSIHISIGVGSDLPTQITNIFIGPLDF